MLDVDTVMNELFRDDDDIVVEYAHGPAAFTVRWDGRPSTPPFRWDGEGVVGIPDDEWLRKLDFRALGFGDTLVAQSPPLAAAPAAVEADLLAAKQMLAERAGFLQSLFIHYVSQTLETQGDQGERDYYISKSLEEMSLVPYKRLMTDAQLTTDMFSFAKLIDIFHMAKTMEAAKTKGGAAKKSLLAPQPFGFVDPKATISFKVGLGEAGGGRRSMCRSSASFRGIEPNSV